MTQKRERSEDEVEEETLSKKTTGKIVLKRELGLFSAVSIILAVMIGRMQIIQIYNSMLR